jgi:hypothetical protein
VSFVSFESGSISSSIDLFDGNAIAHNVDCACYRALVSIDRERAREYAVENASLQLLSVLTYCA